MAVRIPTIERRDPVAPVSIPPIRAEVPNAAAAFAQSASAITKVGQAAQELFVKIENETIDNKAKEFDHQLQRWFLENHEGKSPTETEPGIVGVRNVKGDPTEAYLDFDRRFKEKFDEILSQVDNSGLSDRGKNAIKNLLSSRYNNLYNQRIVSYSQNYLKYQDELTRNDVELESQAAFTNAQIINPNDPSTFLPFAQNLANIENTIIGYGRKTGLVKDSPEGKAKYFDPVTQEVINVELSPMTQVAIKKATSDTLYTSIKNLIDARQFEAARALMNNYDGRIDSVHKQQLNAQLRQTELKAQAASAAIELENKSASERAAFYKTIQDKELQFEIKQQVDAIDRYKENERARASKAAYDQVMNLILERERTSPFVSFTQAMQNPIIASQYSRITDAGQKKAVLEYFDRPKKSDPAKWEEFLNKAQSGELYGMSPSEYMLMVQGLSKEDERRAYSAWKATNLETEAQERSRANYMANEIRKKMILAGLINPNPRTGKLSNEDTRKLFEIETRVRSNFGQNWKGASVRDIDNFVRELIAEEVKKANEEKYIRNWFNTLLGRKPVHYLPDPQTIPELQRRGVRVESQPNPVQTGQPPPLGASQTPAEQWFSRITREQHRELEIEFKKRNGRETETLDELYEFAKTLSAEIRD